MDSTGPVAQLIREGQNQITETSDEQERNNGAIFLVVGVPGSVMGLAQQYSQWPYPPTPVFSATALHLILYSLRIGVQRTQCGRPRGPDPFPHMGLSGEPDAGLRRECLGSICEPQVCVSREPWGALCRYR